MEEWIRIRQRVLREGVSKRQILKETGMHWTTLEKILKYPSPPGYFRTKPPRKSKIGSYLERIRQIIEQDKQMPKKAPFGGTARQHFYKNFPYLIIILPHSCPADKEATFWHSKRVFLRCRNFARETE